MPSARRGVRSVPCLRRGVEIGGRRVRTSSVVLVLLVCSSVVDHMWGMAQRISGSRVTVSSRFDTTQAEGVPP